MSKSEKAIVALMRVRVAGKVYKPGTDLEAAGIEGEELELLVETGAAGRADAVEAEAADESDDTGKDDAGKPAARGGRKAASK